MKILKKLSTLLIIMGVVLGTTALADDPILNGLSYDGSADTITFTIDVTADSVASDIYVDFSFDSSKFSYKSSELASGIDITEYSAGEMGIFSSGTIDTSSSKTLATITLDVIASDKSTVVGSKFEILYDMMDGRPEQEATFTVASAGGEGGGVDLTTPKAGEEITVNEGTLAGKKVVVTTYEGIANGITASTKVKVTYEGEEPRLFGSIFEELKAQGGGTITSGKIVFGVVCSSELDASKFSFALVD